MPRDALAIVALVTLIASPLAATTFVVPSGGATSGACDSWAHACTLQTALNNAPLGSEIWVKAGVYTPGSHQIDSFNILPGFKVYGGFAGTESSRSERDPTTNVTILSGDIDHNDSNTDGNQIDETTTDIKGHNCYHVVTMDGTQTKITATTVLDGFTITGGDASGSNSSDLGGGLYCNGGGAGSECSPTLSNLVFSGNRASAWGGAVYDEGGNGVSSPSISNVIFVGNLALLQGGAMANDGAGGVSSPTLTNVTFSGNRAEGTASGKINAAGALLNYGYGGVSSPTLTDVTFDDNVAQGPSLAEGGAIYNYGEVNGMSSPTLTNVTFNDNHATSPSSSEGGAVFNDGSRGTSSPKLINVTFSGNQANMGGAIYNDGSDGGSNATSLDNVILWGDSVTAGGSGSEVYDLGASPEIRYSVVSGGCSAIAGASCGTGNQAGDPKLGPLQDNGGFTETMALGSGSSAIDNGDDSACPATDQRGVSRPQGSHCDIGAFEAGGSTTGPCVADATHLCLTGSRFEVSVQWTDYNTNVTAAATAVPFRDESGFFYFQDPANIEIMVKVHDACPSFGHFWFFSAATTNVGYTITVTDTETGQTETYSNPAHVLSAANTDQASFSNCP